MSKVVLINELCLPFRTVDNVQGTFQICRLTKTGIMRITYEGGEAEIELGDDVISPILALLPDDLEPLAA